jgi:hypothetical protein
MALTPPVGQAGVPSTPLPSGQVDSLGPTASESEPSDYIPPPSRGRFDRFFKRAIGVDGRLPPADNRG